MVIKFSCKENEKLMLVFMFALKLPKPKSRPRPNKTASTAITDKDITSGEGNLLENHLSIINSMPIAGTIKRKIRFII
jgi:hypothetical protein